MRQRESPCLRANLSARARISFALARISLLAANLPARARISFALARISFALAQNRTHALGYKLLLLRESART